MRRTQIGLGPFQTAAAAVSMRNCSKGNMECVLCVSKLGQYIERTIRCLLNCSIFLIYEVTNDWHFRIFLMIIIELVRAFKFLESSAIHEGIH